RSRSRPGGIAHEEARVHRTCWCGGTAARRARTESAGPHRVSYAGAAGSPTTTGHIAEINEGLRDNGMIEGRDYVLESRFADGRYERFPDLARELGQAG